MKPGAAAGARWSVVALYAAIGAALAGGGMTGGEFAAMVILGSIALVYIVLMDWIAKGAKLK